MKTKISEEIKQNRGGSRSGAGRKASDGALYTYRVQVSIDSEADAIAKKIGNGDRSVGIRKALKKMGEICFTYME
jgi:hypothetical protein